MQPIIYKIRLDAGKAGSQAYIQVKRGDTRSRQLSLYLYNNSVPYEIAPGVLPVIQAIKPDGTVVFDDCEVSGNIIKRLLPAQLFAVSGTVECELVLYGTNGETLYSPRFDIYVDDPLLEDDEITSTSEFTALANALAQANQYKLVWSNPYATAVSGDEAAASIRLTDDGVFFNFVMEKGEDGEDGFSPVITENAENNSDTYKLDIQTESATLTTPNLKGGAGADGEDGEDGEDGFSPVITENAENNSDTYKLDIQTKSATLTTPNLKGGAGADGEDGDDGEDGFSPVITENAGNNSTTYRLNIETKTGTFTTPNLKGKDSDAAVLKLMEINTTAFADAWGDAWPYTQVVDAPGVTPDSQLTVGLNNALVPAADYAIVTAAQLRAVDSAADAVTMEALGTVPTIDIPIIVYDFGVPEPEEPELVVIDLPEPTGSLTYTGGVQSPTWLGYDTATMSIGGTSTATNAGTYYATFTPYSGYMWADGTQEEKSVPWSIGRATVASVPTQSGSLTYNGNSQSPTWNNYDSTELTIGGTTSSTNAGSFSATFTPTANYQWYDGTIAAKNASWSIGRATVSSVPTQSGSLTYNGNSQSPTWNNYDTTELAIGGTTSSTNAGTFYATFTPTANYQWYDGATAAKSAAWSIAKAAGSLSIDKTSVTLNSTATTANITVTRAGDGVISAVSSNTGVATVSVTGNTVTVFSVNSTGGEATVTISVAEGTNHTAPASKTVAVVAEFMPAVDTLANTSWRGIGLVADADVVGTYGWAVHDTKEITFDEPVLGATSIVMEYVGHKYDDLADGSGKATMSFLMKDIFPEKADMFSSSEPIEGWDASYMFTQIYPGILSAIERSIGTGIITPVIKYAGTGDATDLTVRGVTTSIWQASYAELSKTVAEIVPVERPADKTSCYPAFEDDLGDYVEHPKRIKNRNGEADNWWTRTYSDTNSIGDPMEPNFRDVSNIGTLVTSVPYGYGTGVVIGFCVGNPNK